jgi:hypothetical protein
LHDSRIQALSPHPGGSRSLSKPLRKSVLTTPGRHAGRSDAPRRPAPNNGALALAAKWVADEKSPPWAKRYRTGTPWVHVLKGVADHGWTPRDVNQLITDWIGTGHWIPDAPHKPIGLLGAILAAHGNLDERPAALDVAREQEELARAQDRVARQLTERTTSGAAKEAGRAALSGPGREAVRRALAAAAERTRRRRDGLDGQVSQ